MATPVPTTLAASAPTSAISATTLTTAPSQPSGPPTASIVCTPESSTPAWVVPAISSFSGGAFAIAVLWLGHIFTARRERAKIQSDREEARKSLLRGKLESLLALVDQEQDAMREQARYVGALGLSAAAKLANQQQEPKDEGAFDRASAIVDLYFPTLMATLRELLAARLAHAKFVGLEISQIRAGADAWGTNSSADYGTRAGEALKPYLSASAQLAGQARQMIEGELAF
jgi:hypothetical protein